MIKVVLLGYGNVNSHLLKAFSKSEEVAVTQIYKRNLNDLSTNLPSVPFTDKLGNIADADIYIIGISDNAIEDFSKNLPFKNKLVVHTSGGASMDILSTHNRRGIFYPLQTFSKQRNLSFQKIPICIEADDPKDLLLLKKLGEGISKTVVEVSSEKRAKLHVAAVFVNNFVNFLYHVGENILSEEDISFDLLKPLIMETAEKVETLSPRAAQTGPAKRNDTKTISKHLELLDNSPYKEIYEMFSRQLKHHWE